jgi:hypothetical protein
MPCDEITQPKPHKEALATKQNQYRILSRQEINVLNERSNYLGTIQLGVHLAIAGCSGYLYASIFMLA